MKRVLAILLVMAMGLLTACQSAPASQTTPSPSSAAVTPSAQPSDSTAEVNWLEPSDGLRVMTVGTGNPNFDVNHGGGSTLVQYHDSYFLVDCGAMAAYTLAQNGLPITKIENLFFTHQHNDHNADFWTIFVGGWGSPTGRRSLTMAGPGVQELYDMTVDFYRTDLEYRSSGVGFAPDGILSNVEIMDFTEDSYTFEVDGVTISAIPVPHTIDTYAYRFEADGQSVVISGDMTYLEEFGDFAKDADIVVMDGMLTSDFSDLPEEAREGMKMSLQKSHITSEEIGELMAVAQPGKLVLTHLGGSVDIDAVAQQYADQGFDGETILAYDGMMVEP